MLRNRHNEPRDDACARLDCAPRPDLAGDRRFERRRQSCGGTNQAGATTLRAATSELKIWNSPDGRNREADTRRST